MEVFGGSLEVGGGLSKNRSRPSIFKASPFMMSSCLMRAKAIFTGKCEATSRGPREPVLASRPPEGPWHPTSSRPPEVYARRPLHGRLAIPCALKIFLHVNARRPPEVLANRFSRAGLQRSTAADLQPTLQRSTRAPTSAGSARSIYR